MKISCFVAWLVSLGLHNCTAGRLLLKVVYGVRLPVKTALDRLNS